MYSCYLLIILIICGITTLINGYNLDTITHRRYRGDSGSMFGFSIALHKNGDRRVVLVGAPEAQTDQPGVIKGGAVYFCEINGESCGHLVFDSSGSNTNEGEKIDSKSNQWFGATVRSSGSIILACAPRYISYTNMKNRRDPVGTCWVARNGSLPGALDFSEYSPCRTRSWGYHRQGTCQAGLGASVSQDGKRLFLGAVGSWYWQGQLHSIDTDARLPFMPRSYSYFVEGMLVSQNSHSRPDVISSVEGPSTDDDSYLGYSVAAGDFGSHSKHGDVAVGMPRGEGLKGKIVIFTWNMTILQNVTGEQLGAYFGYSVCVSDVNGDGRHDLIVGAPIYTEPNNEGKYETGRIYIYLAPEDYKFGAPITRDGHNSRARFGLALSTIGDITKDGYEDFAVGAPYDGPEERGAVYIFHGSRKGVREKASQIIYSEDFPGSPTTFGFSLSGGTDMDLNEYPDLAIGAYEADVAIFLRARPVVKLDATVVFLGDGKQISLEERNCSLKDRTRVPCIQMRSCLSYSGVGVNQQLDFEIQFILDAKKIKSPRMFFLSDEGKNVMNQTVRLERGQRACKNNFVYLKTNFRDKLTSLDVEMRYSLIGDNPDIRRERRNLFPILDLDEELYKRDSISIQKNCGKDNICIPDLRLIAQPSVTQYLLGSGERMYIDVLAQNEGEDAFEATFKMQVPPGLNYVNIERLDEAEREIPVQCSAPSFANNNTLHCDIGNPLPKEKLVHFKVILQPFHKDGMKPRYDFEMSVNSTNPENKSSLSDNLKHITVPIWVDSDLILSGSSHPVEIHYNDSQYKSENITQENEIGPQVVHIYSIRNKGPSDILEAEAYFLWPSYTLGGEHLLYLLEQPETSSNIKCEIIPEINPENIKIDRKKKSYLDGEGHSLGIQSGLTSEESSSTSSSTSSSSSSSSSSTFSSSHSSSSSSSSTHWSRNSSGSLERDGKRLTWEEIKKIEELEKKRDEEEALRESGDTDRYRSKTKNQGIPDGKHYSSNGGTLESDSRLDGVSIYERGRVEVSRGVPATSGNTYHEERREHSESGKHAEVSGGIRGGAGGGRTYYEERQDSSNTTWKSGEPSITKTSTSWMVVEDGKVRNGSTSNVHRGAASDISGNRRIGEHDGMERKYSQEKHLERNVTWNSRDGGRPIVSVSSSWKTDADGRVSSGSSSRDYEGGSDFTRNRDRTEGSHGNSSHSWTTFEESSSSGRHHSEGGVRHGASGGGHRNRYNEERHHRGGTGHRESTGSVIGRGRQQTGSEGRNRTYSEERHREWNTTWSSADGKPKTTEYTSWKKEDDGIVRSGSHVDSYEGEPRIDTRNTNLLGKNNLHMVTTGSGGYDVDENIVHGVRSGGKLYSEERETSYNTTWNSGTGNKPITHTSTNWRVNEDGVERTGGSSDVYEGTAPPVLLESGKDLTETEISGSRRTSIQTSRTSSSSSRGSERRTESRNEHSGSGELSSSGRDRNQGWEYDRRAPEINYEQRREHSSSTIRGGSRSNSESDLGTRSNVEHGSFGGHRRVSSSTSSESRREHSSSGSNDRSDSRREGTSHSSSNARGSSHSSSNVRGSSHSSSNVRGSSIDLGSVSGGGFDFGSVAQGPRDGVARTYSLDLGKLDSESSSTSGSSRGTGGSTGDRSSSSSGFERHDRRGGHASSGHVRHEEKDEDSSSYGYSRREHSRHGGSSHSGHHASVGNSHSESSGGLDFGAIAQGPRDGVARTYAADLGILEGNSGSSSTNQRHSGHRSSESSSAHRSSGRTQSGAGDSYYTRENEEGFSTRHNEGDYDLGARHGTALSSRHYSSSSKHYSTSSDHSEGSEGGRGGGRGGYYESWSSSSGTADGDQTRHGGSYAGRSISNEDNRGKFHFYPRYKRETYDGVENLKDSLKCGPTRCTKVKCMIGALKNDEEAMVAFRSRVWVRTIKKLSSSIEIHLSSLVAAKVTKLPHIGAPDVVTTHTHEVLSQIMPAEAVGKPDYVPLWVVVLSACAGAIILMLLVYLLYKCGFFKRNRPSSSASEKQPLNRNGHYNGDEAL